MRLLGIVVGEGYIRVASTAPEPSAVNHWRTHHRKEGYKHYHRTQLFGHNDANIKDMVNPRSWMVECKLM